MMYYEWLDWLFQITLEIDGDLNMLSTETIKIENNVYYKNVAPTIQPGSTWDERGCVPPENW